MKAPLAIALVGFELHERAAVALYLVRHLPHGYCLVNDDPQAVVVNLDASKGLDLWEQSTRHGVLPSIVVSIREQQLPNARWLRKPLQAAELLALIERLGTRGPEREGQVPDGDPRSLYWYLGPADDAYRDARARESLFYRPDDYFQGALEHALDKARASGQALSLESQGTSLIRLAVAGGGDYVYTEDMRSLLKKLRFLRANQGPLIRIRPQPSGRIDWASRNDPRLHRAEDMLWRSALWTARGRVPAGTDLDARVTLRYWPNFTRMARPPDAMRIVALWHRRPVTLMDTAKALELPCHVVFSVYSACRAVRLVEAAEPKDTPRVEESKSAVSLPSRLFQSMLGRLRKFTGAS